MRLRPYSTRPAQMSLQVLCDLATVAWTGGWVVVARAVGDSIRATARVGFALQSGAGGVASNLRDAGRGVSQVPLVGGPLGAPLTSAAGAAGGVAGAGHDLGDRIVGAATPVELAVAIVPVVPVIVVWLVRRSRFALRAGAYAQLARLPGGDSLLALRALAGRSPSRLARIDADLAGAWRRDDPEVIGRLADLELRLSGVARPRRRGRPVLR